MFLEFNYFPFSLCLICFLFVVLGSTDEYWKRQDAAKVIALVEYTYIIFFVSRNFH